MFRTVDGIEEWNEFSFRENAFFSVSEHML